MEPYFSDDMVTVHLGDCREILPEMEPESIHAVVCDPPYDLTSGKKGGSGEKSLNTAHPAGRSRITTGGFMGQQWDATGVAFDPDTWRAVMRVLKPGGYLLAFGGTRTWHRLVCAIEDAGFEIRDPIADLTGMDGPGLLWIQSQGYPKNLNVSKAIDKAKRRDFVAAALRLGLSIPARNLDDWTKEDHAPGDQWWEQFKAHLSAEDWQRLEREVTGTGKSGAASIAYARKASGEYDITVPATEDAVRWEGWGTALKPAWEPIAVARKPFTGTVAQNVLRHGTSALNLAACKVPHGSDEDKADYRRNASGDRGHSDNRTRDMNFAMTAGHASDIGRWPPDLVIGEEAAAELDRQSGVLTSGKLLPHHADNGKSAGTLGAFAGAPGRESYGDSGGASRFFPIFKYEPKAGTDERPRLNDGTTHNTVKPVDLMRWLVRLVTPPGGIVLDPFAGSGATGEACIIEGFRSVLIELYPHHAELIMTRLRKPIQPDLFGGAA